MAAPPRPPKTHRVNRLLCLASTVILIVTSTGCTLVGLGIGAAIPKKQTYEEKGGFTAGERVARAFDDEKIDPGDAIEVDTFGPPAPRRVEGTVEGIDPRAHVLGISSGSRVDAIELERIRRARVEHGSHWMTGMFVGLGADSVAALTVFLLYASAVGHIR